MIAAAPRLRPGRGQPRFPLRRPSQDHRHSLGCTAADLGIRRRGQEAVEVGPHRPFLHLRTEVHVGQTGREGGPPEGTVFRPTPCRGTVTQTDSQTGSKSRSTRELRDFPRLRGRATVTQTTKPRPTPRSTRELCECPRLRGRPGGLEPQTKAMRNRPAAPCDRVAPSPALLPSDLPPVRPAHLSAWTTAPARVVPGRRAGKWQIEESLRNALESRRNLG